ncbi:MAG TPA: alpha/beta hydrolase, partial [Candidatus Binataceae bacterium]|nr:alpha/beta hydrolase [Candidatus Binataceae bacterium]
ELGRLAELRAEYEDLAEGNRLPDGVTYEPVMAGGVSAEWVSGPEAGSDGVVLYLHGGCYGMGSVESHRELMTRIAIAASQIPRPSVRGLSPAPVRQRTLTRVLGLNYRLAPANPFPAAVEDAVAAYRWLIENGVEANRIAIAGDSAGAGLAIAASLKLRDDGVALPAALACISPWVDLAMTGESMESQAANDPIVSRAMLQGWARQYLGERDPRMPLASPLYADLRGLPPLLIQVGANEVLLDDARRMAERAAAAGVETRLEVWPEMIHVWHSFAAIMAEGREAIERIGSFVRAHLGIDANRMSGGDSP